VTDTNLATSPEGIRSVMRRALALYRSRPPLYLAIVALPIVPVGIAMVVLGIAAPDPASATERIEAINLIASALLITPIAQGAVSHAVVSQIDGGKPTVRSTLRAVLPRSSVLVGSVLLALVVSIFGLFLLVIPGLIVLVWFQFVGQVVVLENLDFAAALRRCRELVRGSWWRVLGWIVVVDIVAGVASLVAGLLFSVLLPSDGSDRSNLVVPLVASIPANIIVLPFPTIALTLIYLRLRRERPPA
jgi:hypothetical protein